MKPKPTTIFAMLITVSVFASCVNANDYAGDESEAGNFNTHNLEQEKNENLDSEPEDTLTVSSSLVSLSELEIYEKNDIAV
ncbi:MAG: hypothetical protein FWE82_03985 [Defluviitaleaceae bacterium]|nr:hypothetical protein [Defluviitaleaceae bacterium]